jgi:putative ABC transport system substrate-binding protein
VRRREFIKFVGGAAVAWPIVARAQQTTVPVIGFMGSETPELYAPRLRAFRDGLGELGYVEDKNVTMSFQWAGGNYTLFRVMADELVRQKVSVLVAGGTTPATRAALAATQKIPVVFYVGADPVAMGLVPSFNRPGGNATGISGLSVELLAKRIELMHEVLPTAKAFGVLVNPSNWSSSETDARILQETARSLDVALPTFEATADGKFDAVFSTLRGAGVGGLIITSDAYFAVQAKQLALMALRYSLPAISLYRDFADAGGLMTYGGSITEYFRLLGNYTGRILQGESPSELPVQQATKVELVINLKTAKAMGLAVPLSLLARADEVIE